MTTSFATSGRTTEEELADEILNISNSSVISCILDTISGAITVLDDHRQIVATNDAFLKMLEFETPSEALGARPGDALQCIHADEGPSGCGTSKFCSSCPAAIAFNLSFTLDTPVEEKCAITAHRGSETIDLVLQVKSQPIHINQKKYLLIFFQDITRQEQRAVLERTFYHDINNVLQVLLGASELLVEKENSELADIVLQASQRINNELSIQQSLTLGNTYTYQLNPVTCSTTKVLQELQRLYDNHPLSKNKTIIFENASPHFKFSTDLSLLSRILGNMTTNALEATDENGTVKIWIEKGRKQITFCVWNEQRIPSETALRVFQRNFSTKQGSGRGVGTFSMKLFGENVLGGEVSFTTSEDEGTTFRFAHPL